MTHRIKMPRRAAAAAALGALCLLGTGNPVAALCLLGTGNPVAAQASTARACTTQTRATAPAGSPARAPSPAPVAPTPAAAPAYVTLNTAAGAIVVEVNVARAPISARNFLRYVDARRLDGVTFYRALNLGQGYGLIQAGTRGAPAITFPAIAHEPTSRTGLTHMDGAISFARAAPGTANGDFFITIGALSSLDAQPAGSGGDPDGFAVFGRIVAGMDVVRTILAMPTSATGGPAVMRGQMLAVPVRITTARRTAAPPPPPTPAASAAAPAPAPAPAPSPAPAGPVRR